MRRYNFRPINADRGELNAFGWYNPRDPLAETFDFEDLADGPFVLLGARQDRKTLNAILFRARLAKRIREVISERRVARLSRQQRIAIEEELYVQMAKEASPTSAFCQVFWDLATNMLYVGATSSAACEKVQELFQATFDLRIQHESPSNIRYRRESTDISPLVANQRYKSNGREFATWLLCEYLSESFPKLESMPSLKGDIHGPLVLQDELGKLTFQGEDAVDSPEVSAALAAHRQLAKATIALNEHEESWRFTFDSDTFDLKGCILPVPVIPDLNEFLSLRLQAMLRLYDMVDALYSHFLDLEADRSVSTVPDVGHGSDHHDFNSPED
jgi:hypothetical protein